MAEKKDPARPPRETGGPVVKTGPTRGENRSRNQDGQWRKKRSDSGSDRKKSGGCYITTAVCSANGLRDDCYQLQTLRAFRDGVLLKTPEGKKLVQRYYEVAPSIAARLSDESEIQAVWLRLNLCLVAIEQKRNADAIAIYRAMTEELSAKHIASAA